jgi:predicted TIM-barrel fold metal-dependent hydrolase
MTLIDVHAHFHYPGGARADWAERNASRLAAGERIGITCHVASILGSWGRKSPTYFPSPDDVVAGNDAMLAIMREHPGLVQGYVCVNPNYTDHALGEIERCIGGGEVIARPSPDVIARPSPHVIARPSPHVIARPEGPKQSPRMIGIKLAASRRADDPLLDPVCSAAERAGVPILHHIWQHRRKDWPGQEASDAVELVTLARRHPKVAFILAHIGGGGDWLHSLHAVRPASNVYVDLSGSGVDAGMLESCLDAVGAGRMLWGADITMETGWGKLRHLENLISPDDLERIRWKNAAGIFPPSSLAP